MVNNERVVFDEQIAVVEALFVTFLVDARVYTDEPAVPIGVVAVVERVVAYDDVAYPRLFKPCLGVAFEEDGGA